MRRTVTRNCFTPSADAQISQKRVSRNACTNLSYERYTTLSHTTIISDVARQVRVDNAIDNNCES